MPVSTRSAVRSGPAGSDGACLHQANGHLDTTEGRIPMLATSTAAITFEGARFCTGLQLSRSADSGRPTISASTASERHWQTQGTESNNAGRPSQSLLSSVWR